MTPTDDKTAAERMTRWILVSVATWMTAWIAWRFIADPAVYVERRLGFNDGLANTAAWIWLPTLAIVVLYAGYTLRVVPGARDYVLRPNLLGLIAVWAALTSGILEEVLFRHLLMDWLHGLDASMVVQVLVSGIVFGVAHALWAVMGRDRRIIVPVVASTTALGIGLAVLYIAAERSTLPAIAAHIVINLIIEPGLIVSVCRAGMTGTGNTASPVEEHAPQG